ISTLLADAFASDWVVRLCYAGGNGVESEYNAEVLRVNGHSARARRLGTGAVSELTLRRVRWARVLTEAEEELQGSKVGAP
ncbi:MAG: hypothetical protein ACRDZX_03685, partial [Acidimicrobiales bacterium]